MLHTLRGRFILSHILPIVLVMPLVGLALIYLLETQVFISALTEEMKGQAELLAALASDETDVWTSPTEAQLFVNRIEARSLTGVVLLDANGDYLAGDDPRLSDAPGTLITDPAVAAALQGEAQAVTTFGAPNERNILTVWQPVFGRDDTVLGAIRVTHELDSLSDDVARLRFWIVGTLLVALVVGGAVGALLAINLEEPLHQLTIAVQNFAVGGQRVSAPESGPAELRLLSSAYNSLIKRLGDLEKARRQLLANLVHEIGRPLGAMQSAVNALQHGALDNPRFRNDLLNGMESEVSRLNRLLEDLAQLHDRVLGTLELTKSDIPVATWLPVVLSPWRVAAEAKGITWHATLPVTLPTVFADGDRLAQVIGNLVSNAIKFTKTGGRVEVEAGQTGKMLWVRVADTGEGIADLDIPKIFDPFYRSHAHKRFPQGMGLGLTIARDIVTAHGGRIDIESKEGTGTTFTVTIPMA